MELLVFRHELVCVKIGICRKKLIKKYCLLNRLNMNMNSLCTPFKFLLAYTVLGVIITLIMEFKTNHVSSDSFWWHIKYYVFYFILMMAVLLFIVHQLCKRNKTKWAWLVAWLPILLPTINFLLYYFNIYAALIPPSPIPPKFQPC